MVAREKPGPPTPPPVRLRRMRIIDGRVLRTGSANFSRSGETRQDNDLVALRGASVCAGFDAKFDRAWPRCAVPECNGASSFLSRQEEDVLWQAFCMAAPARRRVFEPSSKRRKRAPAPLQRATT